MKIFLGYLLTYTYVFLILIILGILKKKKLIKENTSRKLVHILVGVSWIIMYYYFKLSIHIIILPVTIVVFNFLSYKFNIAKSMEKENKDSMGTIFYAFSFVILATITYFYPKFYPFYGIGIFSMCLGDGLAPFIGKKFNKKLGKTGKTYAGSLIVFLSTFIVIVCFTLYFKLNLNILKMIILSLIAIPLELFSKKGSDNLTLPIGVAVLTYVVESWM